MTIFTYAGNKNSRDGTTVLVVHSGVINLWSSGDFTPDEYALLSQSHVLLEGTVDVDHPTGIFQLPGAGTGATFDPLADTRAVFPLIPTEETFVAWVSSESYMMTTTTFDSNEAISSGTVVWPDGVDGEFVTDIFSVTFPGAIDAYHMTYESPSGITVVITQPLVTRDSNGYVIVLPVLIITL